MKNLYKLFSKRSLAILVLLLTTIIFSSSAQVTVTASAGSSGPTTYSTVNDVFTEINAGTYQGAILITITGNTTEPATPVPLLSSASPSNYTSVTILPSGNVTINGNATATANRGVLEFLGADSVTIDGDDPATAGTRNLTIQRPTSTTAGMMVIRFASATSSSDGASNNVIKNCIILGSRSTSTSTVVNYGIYSGTPGAVAASSSGASYDNDSITIDNNDIEQTYCAIYQKGTSSLSSGGSDGWNITNNQIGPNSSGTTNSIGQWGITINNALGFNITSNTIQNISANTSTSGTGSAAGINLGTSVNINVTNNTLKSISSATTGGYGIRGITINNATSSSNTLIANNMISDIWNYQDASVSFYATCGITVEGTSGGVSIIYNSINMYGSHTGYSGNTSGGVAANIYIASSSGSLDIRNNNLVNTYDNNTSTGDKSYTIYSTVSNTVFSNIDYNNYYVSGIPGILGYIGGTDQISLSAMISGFGGNTHSINTNPPFVSSTDLHLTAGSKTPIESGGTVIATIATDIDGDVRPGPAGSIYGGATAPDMGADEADLILDNIEVDSVRVDQITGIVAPGITNQQIIRIRTYLSGSIGTLSMSDIVMNTAGSTNVTDITAANVYYTGSSSTFSTAIPFGTSYSSPNGSFTQSATQTLSSGVNYIWLTYDVSPSATYTDVIDAVLDSIQISGNYYLPDNGNPTGNITITSPMTYSASTVLQTNISSVPQGSSNNNIVQLQLVMSSIGSSVNATSLDIATTGTTALADIANLNVWYTGNSNTFAATSQFGSTVATPSATQTVSGNQVLLNDTNYFWITYDIVGGATLGDVVDGEITSITVDGTPQTPSVTAPSGSRSIRAAYCTPTYAFGCSGDNIARFRLGTLDNNGTTCANGAYTYFNTLAAPTLLRGSTDTIIVNVGTDANQYGRVWIDYNDNGSFGDPGEDLGIQTPANAGSSGQATFIFTVPCNAKLGTLRLRIRDGDDAQPTSTQYCGASSAGYGQSQDYDVIIVDNPIAYISSSAIQNSSVVGPGTNDAQILRIPLVAKGCGIGTLSEMYFNTGGSTNTSDITAAKLYKTGNVATFNNSNLLGTVSSPSGTFSFTGLADTLLSDTNNYWLTYDISGGATLTDVVDAGIDSLNSIGAYYIPSITNPLGSRQINAPMSFISSTTNQTDLTKVAQGSSNNNIIQLQVITSSTGSPINVTSLDIATTGTSALTDIANLNVWYTGNSNVFATTNQFGSTVTTPSTTQTISGIESLSNDTNYFWITYDIVGGATLGDIVDGEITSVTVDGTPQTPSVTAPTGNRIIRAAYCTPTYTTGTGFSDAINNVTYGGINNTTGASSSPYLTYYSTLTATVTKGTSSSISISVAPAGGDEYVGMWIDFNDDGIFSSSERLINDVQTSGYFLSQNVSIPCSANLGVHRMRLRISYSSTGGNFDPCSSYTYGETEDYNVNVLDNPVVYVSSTAIQNINVVAPGATDVPILRIPVLATGCGIGTLTEMYFNTNGSTLTSDIASAKLYKTGSSAVFNTSNLLGTISSPSGAFSFTGLADTLLSDTNNYWLTYDISGGATLSDVVDAVIDSLNTIGVYYVPSNTNPSGNVEINSPVTYASSIVTQTNTTKVGQGTTNNQIVGLEVVTTLSGSSIGVTSIDVATTGTTSLSDITNLKVWFTGSSNTFATTTQFGSTVSSPAATQTLTGTVTLTNGTNYFWVTYDIASGATITDVVDAEITSVTVDGTPETPSLTAPAGSREIRADFCVPTYTTGTGASDAITNITYGGINNTTGLSSSPYLTYYSGTTATVTEGGTNTFSITVNPAGGDEYVGMWVDFNDDGTFSTSERLINDIQTSGYALSQNILIPVNANTGTHRMRVRISYYSTGGNFDPCSSYTYGETEDYDVNILSAPYNIYVWNQTIAASFNTASNWTPSRSNVNLSDILEFNGGGSVSVTNVPTQTVSQIITTNATTVSLNAIAASTLSVADTLALISGEIITDANTTLSLGSSATSTGVLSGSGTIDGVFSRWISTNTGSYTYPMVVGADNRSIIVEYTTAPTAGGTLTYQFIHGVPSTTGLPLTDGAITDNTVDTSGVFRLTANGLTGGAYTGTFEADNFVGITDYTQLSLIQRNSSVSSWSLNGTMVTTTGSNLAPVLSRTGMTAFGEFGVAGDASVNPLPITLLNFTAHNVNGDVLLNWSTSSEQNNKGFEVERSLDSKNFNFVKFVNGAGNSSVLNNYTSTDIKAFDMNNTTSLYYRLKQTDYNGKYTYSNVVNVLKSNVTSDNISIYPNPSTGRFNLEISALREGLANVVITDSRGQEINTLNIQLSKGTNSVLINLESASNGIYFVKVTMDGMTNVTRITKVY